MGPRSTSAAAFALIACLGPALVPATASADPFIHHERSANDAGFGCGPFASPLAPAAGQGELLRFTFVFPAAVGVYFTTNGADPAGANQTPGAGTGYIVGSACPTAPAAVDELTIPGQPANTQVRYVV